MNFGTALRTILTINDIKAVNLAAELGYDISYISKWLNSSKRPARKNAADTCTQIARYIEKNSDESKKTATARALSFEAEETAFADALSMRLLDIYNDADTRDDPRSDGAANALITSPSVSLTEDVINEVANLYRRSQDTSLEGILLMPPDYIESDYMIIANRICAAENSSKAFRLRQLISSGAFGNDETRYMRYLLRHLSLSHPLRFDFYKDIVDRSYANNAALVVKNGVLIQGIANSITGNQYYSLLTRDTDLVNEYYKNANSYLLSKRPIAERISGNDSAVQDLVYGYALNGMNKYIMSAMVPIHLSPELLDEFSYKYLKDERLRDYHRNIHEITYRSYNSVITFKSVLVNYMNTGRIRLFDKVVTLTRAERKRHLQHLVDELESGNSIDIQILNGHTPLLNETDLDLNVYMNENVIFAADYLQEEIKEVIHFIDPEVCESMISFFEDLQSLPEAYNKTGERAVKYISNGLKMI